MSNQNGIGISGGLGGKAADQMEIDPFSHISIREYFEKLLDEREDKYNVRFAAMDKAIDVALAAKGAGKEQGHWVVGTVIATCAAVLSLGALLYELVRHP